MPEPCAVCRERPQSDPDSRMCERCLWRPLPLTDDGCKRCGCRDFSADTDECQRCGAIEIDLPRYVGYYSVGAHGGTLRPVAPKYRIVYATDIGSFGWPLSWRETITHLLRMGPYTVRALVDSVERCSWP